MTTDELQRRQEQGLSARIVDVRSVDHAFPGGVMLRFAFAFDDGEVLHACVDITDLAREAIARAHAKVTAQHRAN